ncbi:MAG TPA: AraC family transcriptional regulator [Ktedonobacteraceae bacterium]
MEQSHQSVPAIMPLPIGKGDAMNYRACIQASIDYIEDHLKEDLTAEALAGIACFSPYHYSRVFHAYVGRPLMEYVRCRRLAYAAVELVQGKRIIDIALDYGFETHNGFGKAFRKVYGCSPEKYRLHGSGQVPTKVDLFLLAQYNLRGAIVMEPQIVTKLAFKVAGYELKTTCRDGKNFQEIPAFWGNMTAERFATLHNKLHSVGEAELGLCFQTDPANGDMSYVISVEVSDFNGVPADLFTAEMPETVYAIFTTSATDGDRDISQAIQGTWRYIYETWLPGSGYEFAEGKADFELYPCNDKGEKVKIYIPIVKK